MKGQNKMKHNLTKSSAFPQVISPETGLTAIQERCAALIASGTSITDAAEELGISRGCVYRWQRLLPFNCYFNSLKKDVKAAVEGRLLGLHSKALESLEACLASSNEAIKLKAAVWILDKASQQQEQSTNIREELMLQAKKESSWDWQKQYQKSLEEAGLEE